LDFQEAVREFSVAGAGGKNTLPLFPSPETFRHFSGGYQKMFPAILGVLVFVL
jgi:hypothetical protein